MKLEDCKSKLRVKLQILESRKAVQIPPSFSPKYCFSSKHILDAIQNSITLSEPLGYEYSGLTEITFRSETMTKDANASYTTLVFTIFICSEDAIHPRMPHCHL